MPGRYVSERFVGRERELSRLAVALDAAADGRSPRVVIGGGGGVGVSRLVEETVRRVGRLAEPFRVVRCVAVPAGTYAVRVTGIRPTHTGSRRCDRNPIRTPDRNHRLGGSRSRKIRRTPRRALMPTRGVHPTEAATGAVRRPAPRVGRCR